MRVKLLKRFGGDETDSVRMPSAVSTPSGVSQVTLDVSFPGSAHLSFTLGHLIFGGSISTERVMESFNKERTSCTQ